MYICHRVTTQLQLVVVVVVVVVVVIVIKWYTNVAQASV